MTLVTRITKTKQNISAAPSRAPAAAHAQIARRRIAPSHPLQMRQFSAALPWFRRRKMSIQRHHGSLPPVISAGNLQNMQNL